VKLLVCVKVQDTGGSEPLVETRVATTDGEACKALADLEGFEIGPGDGYSTDPFELAEELSQDDRHFYVEAHALEQPAPSSTSAQVSRK